MASAVSLTGSGCVCSAGFFERERRAGSLAPLYSIDNTRLYIQNTFLHNLTQVFIL